MPPSVEKLPRNETFSIDRTVKSIVTGNGKNSRRASNELEKYLDANRTSDGSLLTIQALQGTILTLSNPQNIKTAFETLNTVIDRLILPKNDNVGVNITYKRENVPVIDDIRDKTHSINESKSLQRYIKPPFSEFLHRVVPSLVESQTQTGQIIHFEYTSPRLAIIQKPEKKSFKPQPTNEDLKRAINDLKKSQESKGKADTESDEKWTKWVDSMNALHDEYDSSLQSSEITLYIDKILTAFQNQPFDLTTSYLFEQEIRGLSLAGMRDMSHPLSRYDTHCITRFFTGLTEAELHDKNALRTTVQNILFMNIDVYEDDNVPLKLDNWHLINTISAWRENFWYGILYENDERILNDSIAFLRSLPEHNRPHFMFQIPDIMGAFSSRDTQYVYENNPFFTRAMNEYQTKHTLYESAFFVQPESVWIEAYERNYQDRFRERIRELGIEDLVSFDMRELYDYIEDVKTYTPQIVRSARVAKFYEEEVPSTFKEVIEQTSADITEEAHTIWLETLQTGLQTLPLSEGVDIIHFTKHSTPYKMGLSKIYMNLQSAGDEWGVNIRFDFVDTYQTGSPLSVSGVIDHDGAYNFSTPIDKFTPGLEALLYKVAVLTFKDLSYQQDKEELLSDKQKEDIPTIDTDEEKDNNQEKNKEVSFTPIPRKHKSVRRRSEIMLKNAITPKVSRDPRRIATHKMNLYGFDEYASAVREYVATKSSIELIAQTKGFPVVDALEIVTEHNERHNNLTDKRKKLRKVSYQKRQIWPENVGRTQLTDPQTRETMYSNTWVAEHTSPKLTPDQELEIVLWQRNYRTLNTVTTALSLLDSYRELLI